MHPPRPASAAWAPRPGRPASGTNSDYLAIVLHRLHPDPRIRQEEQLFQPEQYLAHSQNHQAERDRHRQFLDDLARPITKANDHSE
ncbi:hypothetical protein Sfulv_60660 [Streptomyces fulvorobeus]|uniref:Uncharacterized protein n=1 Tax=Streptomyces fulvorobeus TaxID=284028 RepID=A0A7J0CFJ6_9ACTN|nr:hypothetical protein Sfulv_60660 [Streptomyces fulvorobeus]